MPKQKLNLFEFAAAIVAESGAGTTKIVGCQIVYAGLPGTPLDRIPDNVGGHASILSLSILRNSSEYSPLAHSRMRSQASRSCLHHDGTGTVRSRLPLPIKSTMTQCPSLICSCSSVNPTTSERRNPQPRSKPRIAPSRQPRRSVFEAAFTSSCAWFRRASCRFYVRAASPLNSPDSNRQFRTQPAALRGLVRQSPDSRKM